MLAISPSIAATEPSTISSIAANTIHPTIGGRLVPVEAGISVDMRSPFLRRPYDRPSPAHDPSDDALGAVQRRRLCASPLVLLTEARAKRCVGVTGRPPVDHQVAPRVVLERP